MVTNNHRRPPECSYSYKVRMDYNGKDYVQIDGDRVQQYAALKLEMAKKYVEESFLSAETHF